MANHFDGPALLLESNTEQAELTLLHQLRRDAKYVESASNDLFRANEPELASPYDYEN